jgi:hypothetical protein
MANLVINPQICIFSPQAVRFFTTIDKVEETDADPEKAEDETSAGEGLDSLDTIEVSGGDSSCNHESQTETPGETNVLPDNVTPDETTDETNALQKPTKPEQEEDSNPFPGHRLRVIYFHGNPGLRKIHRVLYRKQMIYSLPALK